MIIKNSPGNLKQLKMILNELNHKNTSEPFTNRTHSVVFKPKELRFPGNSAGK